MRIVTIGQKALFIFKILFIFDCAESLLLRGIFPCCREWGWFLVTVYGLLAAVASLVTEHGSRA